MIGPFRLFDGRAFLSQSILNFKALNDARAGAQDVKAADYSYQDTRDLVALVVADLYLQSVAGGSRIEAARAQVQTAKALYDQAVDRKEAGLVPAIEVLRAQVQLQTQQQRLIFFQNEFEKQKLTLARAIGLPLEQPFRLTDSVPYAPLPAITFVQALERAYGARRDYRSAIARWRAAELTRKAAASERLPTLAFNSDYGMIGPGLFNMHGTFTAAATLTIPLFQGGRIRGEVLEAEAALRQRWAEVEDLRSRIEFEMRTVFLDMRAAANQVEVARSARQLAEQQMEQARDRFVAGVASNLEVVQAQESLATASENYISSLYAYNLAKGALARALGGAEKSVREFLMH